MKAILLLLCQTLIAGEFRLVNEAGRLVAEGVEGAVQLFTSSNLRDWLLEREFTGSTSSAISRPFARAVAKPVPPAVTIERIDATGTKATIYAKTSTHTVSAKCGIEVEGQIIRHEFSSKGIIGTSWKLGPWNPASSNVTCSFSDPYGQTVSTNLTITFRGFRNPITVEHPLQGMAVVGDNIIVMGDVDRCQSTVWIDANQSSWPCAVINGGFVSPSIPIKASNLWKVHCVNDRGENVSMDLAFSRSAVTIVYQIKNLTASYGECGIYLSGGISDWSYDLVVAGKTVVTTNGFWQVMIPPPPNGVIPFSVLSKYGRSSAIPEAGTIEFVSEPFAFSYAETVSRTFTNATHNNVIMSRFAGYDRTNTLLLRFKQGRDCTLEFSGLGSTLSWVDTPESCGRYGNRGLWPSQSISEFDDVTGVDRMANQSMSGCAIYTGGRQDGRAYNVRLNMVLMKMTTRFEDECWFEQVPTSHGWHISNHEDGWTFLSTSGNRVDATATMPIFGQGWYQYGYIIEKQSLTQ